MRISSLQRWRKWGLPFLLSLNAACILFFPAFTTVDGWAHGQTARMLFHGYDPLVYCPNPASVPNMFGHLLLGALQEVMPALVAERVLLALIVLGLGVGVHSLARAFGGANLLILLVLPFTYNFMLVLGFHNFLLGTAMALLFAAWWIKAGGRSWVTFALFVLASGALYSTHATGVALFLLITGASELQLFFASKHPAGATPARRWWRLLAFGAACLPVFLATLQFDDAQGRSWTEATPAANLAQLADLSVLGLYGGEADVRSKLVMRCLLLAGVAIILFLRVAGRTDKVFLRSDVLLIAALILAMAEIWLPDDSGYANYITIRAQLFALLLLVAWLSAQRVPWPLAALIAASALVLQYVRLDHISASMAGMRERVVRVREAAAYFPEGSIVLPISHEDNWLLWHIPSLLAVERDIVLLEDYECSQNYFPLVWCNGLPPALYGHLQSRDGCLDWLLEHSRAGQLPVIDHIAVLGNAADTTHCRYDHVQEVLSLCYRKAYDNNYVRIYRRAP